ncbi:uncharacterized protein LOC125941608 isoform X2 [Dermacentor silvarum]|uniref:uncharacterized protein LOC125941608 isoform X2 n=1 Tax=Dermacentor silvarum TaxID=543639 RepID=UPI0021016257|nr:uncharacterized protein LOC125941608 isoform X2 [Dermacentor silvarum]
MAAARIQRWALSLGGYQYKLQYVPGKQLLTADALSRLPVEATGPTLDGDPPEYVLSLEALDEGVPSKGKESLLRSCSWATNYVRAWTRVCRPGPQVQQQVRMTGLSHQAAECMCGIMAPAQSGRQGTCSLRLEPGW